MNVPARSPVLALSRCLCHHAAMIEFATLDLMARGGTMALLALWSWLLVRDHWQALAARVAVAMNVAIACHVVASVPSNFGHMGWIDVLLDTGSSLTIGLFWLFTCYWFDDAPRVSRWRWIVVLIPSAIVMTLDISQFNYRNELEFRPEPFGLWFLTLRAIWFAFAIGGLWTAWRGRDGDLVEGRRRMRLNLVLAVGALSLLVNIVEIAVFVGGAPIEWRSIVEIGITVSTAVICASMFEVRQADLFGPVRLHNAPRQVVPDDPLAGRLRALMEGELPHRDETLTIAALAARLGEQEYRLRRLINGQLGYRNFAQFLNGYRLAEVKAALADPAQRDVPILTIALDAGFGSLGPFNRAFRDAERMTPSEYRARNN